MTKEPERMSQGQSESRGDPLGLISGGEGIITGTVVCAAVIAAGVGHITTTGQLTAAILGTVFVYWLAHLHAHTLGSAVAGAIHPLTALKSGLAHTWPIAAASVLPVGILLIAKLAGAELRASASIALFATTALLAGYSFFAGRRGGLGYFASLVSAAAGALLGVAIILLKAALH